MRSVLVLTGLLVTTLGASGVVAAANIGVTPTKLVVVDKLTAAGKAKTVYVSKDQAAGITKGAGNDVDQISMQFSVVYGNAAAAGSFALPAGASNGTAGWLVNKDTVAKYGNKDAPGGATEAKVGVIKPNKLLKLVGKGLGDVALDVLGAGDPAGSVFTAFCVTNAGDENCHCSEFPECAWKSIAGDTGAKLVCKGGAPDSTCTASTPPSTGPCDNGQFPTCGGTCPTGDACRSVVRTDSSTQTVATECSCVPEAQTCASGGQCVQAANSSCGPAESFHDSECGAEIGSCPAGETCLFDLADFFCIPGSGGFVTWAQFGCFELP